MSQPVFADTGEILVQFKGSDDIHAFTPPEGSDIAGTLAALQKNSAVHTAEVNGSVRIAAAPVTPNDALFSKQPYLEQINAPGAWAVTTGSSKVVVAVLDSGVAITHPDLEQNIWTNEKEIPGDGIDNDSNGFIDDVNGWDFVNEMPDPTPKFGGSFTDAGIHHGTLIAGIIASRGNNAIGTAGVTWRSKIMPLRVLNNRGEGDILTVIKAVEYAINQKADILNLSFVGDTNSALLKDALQRAYAAGIVVVAASGNDEINRHGVDLYVTPLFPACYHEQDVSVISVASLDQEGRKANFSNFGQCIDISAPGVDFHVPQVVRYEQPGFDLFYGSGWSGTSLSTAVISGVVALLKSINPALTQQETMKVLRETCDSTDGENPNFAGKLGCGQVNAERAVQRLLDTVQQQIATEVTFEAPSMPALIALAPRDGKMPLRLFDKDGSRDESKALLPFDPARPPYTVAVSPSGDMLVAAVSQGGGPHVRIFDRDFGLLGQFFAYAQKFRGGVSIAVGDVDGDGADEIVTVPGVGGGPHVRIFDQNGGLKGQFFAYDAGYRGGLRVTVGDINGDGSADIIVTPLRGSRRDVKVFQADGSLITRFVPYPKANVANINLAVGDIDGDGSVDIVTAPALGAAPVKVFSSAGVPKASFYPYGNKFRGGISLAVGDVTADHTDDIVTAPMGGGGPHVRIFRGDGSLISQFFPLPPSVRRGLVLSIVP